MPSPVLPIIAAVVCWCCGVVRCVRHEAMRGNVQISEVVAVLFTSEMFTSGVVLILQSVYFGSQNNYYSFLKHKLAQKWHSV
jgi:hypothetical protein